MDKTDFVIWHSNWMWVAKQFGYPVFNADKEVIKIYKENKSCFKKLRNKLPKYIIIAEIEPT